jgi:hypothetical protein
MPETSSGVPYEELPPESEPRTPLGKIDEAIETLATVLAVLRDDRPQIAAGYGRGLVSAAELLQLVDHLAKADEALQLAMRFADFLAAADYRQEQIKKALDEQKE